MKRRLLNLLVLLSLLLCVAACALWVRSYHWMDQLRWWLPRDTVLAVYSDHGRVYLAAARPLSHPKRGWEREARDVAGQPGVWERDADASNYSVSLLGFGYANADGVEGIADFLRLVTVPHGSLCLALAALPAARLARALRHRRHSRAGLCLRCGYDLRATPGRCPECGEGVVSKPAL
jgi:hypothetical protein